MSGRRLLTVAEVAQLCRVEPPTVYSWRSKKFGPKSFRLGGRVVFNEADVEAWIEQQSVEADGATS